MPFKILFVYLLITVHGTQVQRVEINLNKPKRDQQVKTGHWKECKAATASIQGESPQVTV